MPWSMLLYLPALIAGAVTIYYDRARLKGAKPGVSMLELHKHPGGLDPSLYTPSGRRAVLLMYRWLAISAVLMLAAIVVEFIVP